MAWKFRPINKKQPVWKVFRGIIKPFYKAKVTYLIEEVPQKAIVLANHSAKNGPVAYDVNYPVKNAKWGTYQMFGNFKSRFDYLRNVFYIQKCHFGKTKATIKATFEAIFSRLMYKGMNLIPTYSDQRFIQTIKYSLKVLEQNKTVIIFPENSNEGYFEQLTEIFPGFISLSEAHFKKTGEDLPIIPMYYHKKYKRMIVGKPKYLQKLREEGMDNKQVCEFFKEEINKLFRNHIEEKPAK